MEEEVDIKQKEIEENKIITDDDLNIKLSV